MVYTIRPLVLPFMAIPSPRTQPPTAIFLGFALFASALGSGVVGVGFTGSRFLVVTVTSSIPSGPMRLLPSEMRVEGPFPAPAAYSLEGGPLLGLLGLSSMSHLSNSTPEGFCLSGYPGLWPSWNSYSWPSYPSFWRRKTFVWLRPCPFSA